MMMHGATHQSVVPVYKHTPKDLTALIRSRLRTVSPTGEGKKVKAVSSYLAKKAVDFCSFFAAAVAHIYV